MENSGLVQYTISKMPKGPRQIFEENPYCILGLPCYASREEVLERRDKLARMSRIGAVDSFVSEFDLAGVEKPNRDHGSLQVAVSHQDRLDDVWLWFVTGIYAKAWQLQKRNTGIYDVSKTYDGFLAAYLFALISDPSFRNTDLWKLVFDRLSGYLHMTDEALLNSILSRVGKEKKESNNSETIIKSFKRSVVKPLLANISELDGESIQRIFSDCNTFSFLLDEYGDALNERILGWVSEKLVPLTDSTEKYEAKGNHRTTKEETDEAYRALYVFSEVYFPICKDLELSVDPITSGMMMSKIKDAFYLGVNPLLSGGRKAEAGKFESLIFKYCNAFQKKEIKKNCPLEYLDIPDTEFTAEECRTIATTFKYEGEGAQPDKYFLWMMRAAERGDATGQNSVGFCYDRGYGCEQNFLTATKWFRRAAQNGSSYGWSNLALYYRLGRGGCSKNVEEGFNCLIIACLLYPDAHLETMRTNHPDWELRFEKQFGIRFDADLSTKERLSDQGNAYAQSLLGMSYYNGYVGCKKDLERSRRLLLRSSLGNCSWASVLLKSFFAIDDKEATSGQDMFNLALRYSESSDLQSNDLRFYWYSKSVANNYSYAYNNLGVCYHDGIGTDKNLVRATECYRKAVEAYPNNEVALYNYGRALYNGEGTERDPGLAKIMLRRSADANYEKASEFLDLNFISEPEHEIIYNNLYLTVYCEERTSKGVILKCIVENHDNKTYDLWAKNIWSNGHRAKQPERKLIGLSGEVEAQVRIPLNIPDSGKTVDFLIAINDDKGNELQKTSLISLEIEDVNDDFTYKDYEGILIYNKSWVTVDFQGITFEEENTSLRFTICNRYKSKRNIWINHLVVDNEELGGYISIGNCPGNTTRDLNYSIEKTYAKKGKHTFVFAMQVDDEMDFEVGATEKITVTVDFDEESISVV